jgi:cell wall-associated NlpC family hydrolase
MNLTHQPHRPYLFIVGAAAIAAGAIVALGACSVDAGEGGIDSEELVGAPEDVTADTSALTGSLTVGAPLKTTSDLNLRTGPSTTNSIIHVIPNGGNLTLVQSSPTDGFYKVNHDGTVGWASGSYLVAVSASSAPRDAAISRAISGVGFSYYWGHGRFRPEGPASTTAGSCSGGCPDCTHSGTYGGDCSGFVAKVWQVPSSNTDLTIDSHPYSTVNFDADASQWSTVSRSSVVKGDAMVYNDNGAGHIFIYKSGDGFGSMYAYECKGCSTGCVFNLRTASTAYHAIRRAGW